MSNNEEQPKASSAGTYEVGYGKPPKNSQFQKGKSGNPKGRPKGTKSLTSIWHEIFHKPVTVTHNGKPTKMTVIAALAWQVVARAIKDGDLKALQLALKIYDKVAGASDPNSMAELMAGQSAFELTAEDLEMITKDKLLDGVS